MRNTMKAMRSTRLKYQNQNKNSDGLIMILSIPTLEKLFLIPSPHWVGCKALNVYQKIVN